MSLLPRRVTSKFRNVALVQWFARWRNDRAFAAWQAANPGGTYAHFYAAVVTRKMGEGKHHYTLGSRGWVPGHGEAVEWAPDSFAQRGLALWEQVRAFGLTPDMRCVDYGCGSLRLGQHAMRFLDAGNYAGIDVVDTFINQGLALIDPALIADKAPRLATISDESIAGLAAWKPAFIFSNAVVQHVPPAELDTYFKRLAAMMGPGARAFVLFIDAPRRRRVKAMNWAYPAAELMAALTAAAPGLSVEIGDVGEAVRMVDGRARRVLRISAA